MFSESFKVSRQRHVLDPVKLINPSRRSQQFSSAFPNQSTTSIDSSWTTRMEFTAMFIRAMPASDLVTSLTTMPRVTITTSTSNRRTTLWLSHNCSSLKAPTEPCSGVHRACNDIHRLTTMCKGEAKTIKRLRRAARAPNRRPSRPPRSGKAVSCESLPSIRLPL